jgi:pimeloyl-ACP methyl ester carboxylesterase
METTGTDGVRIAYETAGGGGVPLVLLHGFFGDRTTWRSAGYVDTLTDFGLVLVDARGHGGSDAPHDPAAYRIERQAEDVVAVMDALGVQRAAVWGASMGGIVALHLMARHPGRLLGVVAGAAHAEAVSDPVSAEEEAAILRTQGVGPFVAGLERQGPLPGWMRTAMERADPHALAALTLALDERDGVLGALADTVVPSLFLAGSRDAALPAIRRSVAGTPGAHLRELAGCGHFETFARADLAVPVVRPFLETWTARR